MKKGCLYVDGIDVWEEYGVYVMQGGYNELISWASLKDVDTNDWQEEDGIEADLEAPVLDKNEVNIEFAVVGIYSSMFRFIDLLSDESYHTFDCAEIGRTFKLRLMSSGSLKTLKLLGKLKLKFSDDFPLDGYEYEAPESTLPEDDNYLLDDVPFSNYGVRILKGTYDEISNPADVKENLLRKLPEEAGVEYDPMYVTYKSKDVKLTCLIRAENLEGLWRNYLALLHDLIQPDERILYVADFEQEFPCYYKKCKVKEFMAKDVPWLKFELTLTFTRDFRIDDDEILLASEDYILVFTEDNENAIDMKPITGGLTTYGTPTITSVTYDDIPMEGGSVTPTVQFRQRWTDTKGNSGILTQDTTDYTVEYKRVGVGTGYTIDTTTGAVSTENVNADTSRKAAAAVGVTVTANGKTSSSTTVNVYQAAPEKTWETPVVLSLAYDDIPNSGGTVTPTMAFYQRWTDTLGNSGTITEEDTSDYTTLYSPSLAIDGVTVNRATGAVTAKVNTIQERTAVVQILCQVTANGMTSSNTSSAATTTVYQQSAAVRTYELPVITNFTYDTIPASGGISVPTIEFTQAWSDTDGNSGTLTQDTTDYSVAYSALSLIYGASINLTTGDVSMSEKNPTEVQRQIASVQATVTANGQQSVLHIAYVTQEKGEITYTYGTPNVTCLYGYLSNTIGDNISPSILVTQTREGSDGSVTTLYLQPSEYDISFNANDSGGLENATLNTSTGVITCIAANSTPETLQIGVVNTNVTANGRSGSAKTNIYQAAGDVTYTYGTPEVNVYYPLVPNTGGTVSPTYSYTQIRTGNDGSSTAITSGGSLAWSISNKQSDVSFDESTGDLTSGVNTSDSSRTLGTVQLSVTMNGQTGSQSVAVAQAARTYSDEYAWSDLHLSYPTAENTAGSVSPNGLTYTLTRTRTYTDGTTETTWWTDGATVTYSMTASGSGISINSSTGEVSFPANTSDSQKNLGQVIATLTLDGQTATVTQTIYQAARTFTYSTPEITEYVYDDIPAGGGTAYPTVSYSQTRTGSDGSTATIIGGGTLSYTYGSVYDDNMEYDPTTGAVTTSTVNGITTRRLVCTMRVTVTLNGESGTATAEVYQEARPSFTEPVVNLASVTKTEGYGQETRVWFTVSTTLNDASEALPSYLVDEDGNQYPVYTDDGNYATLPGIIETDYTLYSHYTGNKGGVEFSGDVPSENVIRESDGEFSIR